MPHSIAAVPSNSQAQPVLPVDCRDKADLYDRAADLVAMGAWSCNLESDELTWTGGVFELFGLARDARIARQDIVGMYQEESRDLLDRLRSRAIETCAVFSMDAQIVRPDGAERWMRVTAAPRSANGRTVELYGMKQDITAERQRWQHLRLLAGSDALTGLANRNRFQSDFLDQAVGSAVLAPVGALLLLEMGNFKAINDRWGHAAGDACLSVFGQRLLSAFPDAALTARIGGNEFALVLPSDTSRIALGTSVYSRMRALLAPVPWNGDTISPRISVGMGFTDDPWAFDPEALCATAGAALSRAKCDNANLLHHGCLGEANVARCA